MTNPLTTIPVRLKVLTPVHIGSGTELLLDYDIIPRGGKSYRVNEDALLEDKLAGESDSAAVDRVLQGRPPRELLTAADYARSELFRYVVPGVPFTVTPGSKVREQIKDVYDQVYLPGSSLKGALRTMLFWAYYADKGKKPDMTMIPERGDPRRVADQLERSVFVPNPAERRGSAPNYDWLRTLHVADSEALPTDGRLQVRTAMIYPTKTPKTEGLRVDVEAVSAGSFRSKLVIDEYGFDDPDAAAKLEWSKTVERERLAQLASIGRRYAEHRLRTELAFYRAKTDAAAVAQLMQVLLDYLTQKLPPNAFLLQLGWGTGWEDKTLGSSLLRQRAAEFEGLLEDYRMNKPGATRTKDDPFPKTRAVIMHGDALEAPPGWVEVRLDTGKVE